MTNNDITAVEDDNDDLHIIFDADGTLRRCTVPGQPCPNKSNEWELIPGVKEALSTINTRHLFSICSNQGGVGLGIMSYEDAFNMLMDLGLEAFGEHTYYIQMCPHKPDEGCHCRKPKPGMLKQLIGLAVRDGWANKDRTLFVGDMLSDHLAADNAGIRFATNLEFFGNVPYYLSKQYWSTVYKFPSLG